MTTNDPALDAYLNRIALDLANAKLSLVEALTQAYRSGHADGYVERAERA